MAKMRKENERLKQDLAKANGAPPDGTANASDAEPAKGPTDDGAAQQKKIQARINSLNAMAKINSEAEEPSKEDEIRFNHEIAELRAKLVSIKPPAQRRTDLQKKLKGKKNYISARGEKLDKMEAAARTQLEEVEKGRDELNNRGRMYRA